MLGCSTHRRRDNVMVKKEWSLNSKLSIHRWIYVPTLTCCKDVKKEIQAAEKSVYNLLRYPADTHKPRQKHNGLVGGNKKALQLFTIQSHLKPHRHVTTELNQPHRLTEFGSVAGQLRQIARHCSCIYIHPF